MILAFIPAQISPNTLNTMTAFAVRAFDTRSSLNESDTLLHCRQVGCYLMFSCISYHTRFSENHKVEVSVSSSWRRSETFLLGT
jgi:hypothetical protein